ncbi:MAG: hypothetical protein HY315_06070 [Acidobacteria bacterium]|nr:hypothetical protein [Acidobacteriota bacterium]
MPPLMVQTGSVPELLYILRSVLLQRPIRILAFDSENVRQYLRGLEGLQLRFFKNVSEAGGILREWEDSTEVAYIGGPAFPSVQKMLRRSVPAATALFPGRQADWGGFLETFQSRLRRDAVLLIQTESVEFIEEYLRDLFPQHGFVRPSFSLLCHQKDKASWQRAHPDWRFWSYAAPSELPEMAMELRRQHFDASVVFFAGSRGVAGVKLLSLACGARQKLAVNENRQFILISPGSLLRFGYQRWRYGATSRWADSARTLIVQTADDECMKAILEQLKELKALGNTRYSLLAREDRAGRLADPSLVGDVLTYPEGAKLKDGWTILQEVRKRRFDAAVLVLTRQPHYRSLKWLPFVAGIRHKLIFNRHGDCFFFTLRRFLNYWIGRYEGMLGTTRVLVFQTWDEARMKTILERLSGIRLFPKPRYSLITRQDKVQAYASLDPPLEEIMTYPVGAGLRDYWRSLREIRKKRFDAAVVAFTKEPTFQKLKWLPFLSGIRHKLIFNRHLDCFFFTPGALMSYWAGRQIQDLGTLGTSAPQLLRPVLLPLARALAFPFRFCYLLVQVTGMKLRRAALMRNPPQQSGRLHVNPWRRGAP